MKWTVKYERIKITADIYKKTRKIMILLLCVSKYAEYLQITAHIYVIQNKSKRQGLRPNFSINYS